MSAKCKFDMRKVLHFAIAIGHYMIFGPVFSLVLSLSFSFLSSNIKIRHFVIVSILQFFVSISQIFPVYPEVLLQDQLKKHKQTKKESNESDAMKPTF